MAEECPKVKCPAGIPAWVLTFADLMSLLMCFFVLLLSFAEMDVIKYKQIAGSMKSAFGVQRDIKAYEPPKGVSIIAREFSPAPPQPTVINQVKQVTEDDTKQELLLVKHLEELELESTNLTKKLGKAETEDEKEEIQTKIEKVEEEIIEAKKKLGQVEQKIEELQQKEIIQQAMTMATSLKQEIESGEIEIETNQDSFLIRIKDKGAFPPGSARLTDDFIDVLEVIKRELAEIKGSIIVAGHTDDVPINTAAFRSNWDLSAERSVSVVQELLFENKIEKERLSIQAFADSRPLVPNDNPENRSKNRRVEIVVSKSVAELNSLEGKDAVGLENEPAKEEPRRVAPEENTDEPIEQPGRARTAREENTPFDNIDRPEPRTNARVNTEPANQPIPEVPAEEVPSFISF
ncbi:MAG: OmpA family protein [Gammaproteobacteria bacterium]|nr:OmpA family protein [Gammaproteobacteria bacterium]